MNWVVFTELYCLYWTIKIRQTCTTEEETFLARLWKKIVLITLYALAKTKVIYLQPYQCFKQRKALLRQMWCDHSNDMSVKLLLLFLFRFFWNMESLYWGLTLGLFIPVKYKDLTFFSHCFLQLSSSYSDAVTVGTQTSHHTWLTGLAE